MDMSLSKLRLIVKDREAWRATVHGVTKLDKTERLNNNSSKTNSLVTSSIKHLRQIADHTLVLSLSIYRFSSKHLLYPSIYL